MTDTPKFTPDTPTPTGVSAGDTLPPRCTPAHLSPLPPYDTWGCNEITEYTRRAIAGDAREGMN